jgi:hypothetical protein
VQVLDAFLTGSDPADEGVRDWQLRFVHVGGVESIGSALHEINNLARQLPVSISAISLSDVARSSQDLVPPTDTVALTMALLCRALHALMSLDPAYSSAAPPQALPRSSAVALINATATLTEGMDGLFCLAKARSKPSPATLLSAVQHVMLLLAGYSTMASGAQAVQDYPRLEQWMSAFTLKVSQPLCGSLGIGS